MLKNGVYLVKFSGPRGADFGTVVLQGGRIHGGDTSYYYVGSLTYNEKTIEARVRIARHPQGKGVDSVFGPLGEAMLDLVGSGDDERFMLNGSVKGAPNAAITVSGQRSSALDDSQR